MLWKLCTIAAAVYLSLMTLKNVSRSVKALSISFGGNSGRQLSYAANTYQYLSRGLAVIFFCHICVKIIAFPVSVVTFSVPADLYLRFPYLRIPPTHFGICVFDTCIFHLVNSYLGFSYLCIPSPGTVLTFSVLAFQSTLTGLQIYW